MRRLRLLLSLVLCLLAAVSAVTAQEDAGAGKELRAYRITGNAPEIDGNIEDEVWLAAGSIDDFTQQEPDNMSAPRERTVVQVAMTIGSCMSRPVVTFPRDRPSAQASVAAAAFPRATRSRSRSIHATIT
jgi:hypothetical protein